MIIPGTRVAEFYGSATENPRLGTVAAVVLIDDETWIGVKWDDESKPEFMRRNEIVEMDSK